MKIKRRTFLATSTSAVLGTLADESSLTSAEATEPIERPTSLARTICPYCAVGCGVLVRSNAGKIVSVEGDPDHPINAGSLCAKGSALVQLANNPRRLTQVKYRAPGSNRWVLKDWDWAAQQIAQRIRKTRDESFQTTDTKGRRVNRTEAIGWLGGAALNNEECYLSGKLARALGIVYLEHQARVCHSSTVAALAASFGRGAMTNHWIDLANSDCILIIGANAAENHPIAMKWATLAQQRGAKLISIDPRFTRTSAAADVFAPLRPGTDIALIGGLIHYAIEHDMIHREYLAAHTNAPFLVDPKFAFDAGQFGPIEDGRYTREHWTYQRDSAGHVLEDPSLTDPNCVFQRLKTHFSRYTFDRVSRVCGTPIDRLTEVADTFLSTHRADRAGTILFAMGATQSTHGTQNIRSFAILQLLLGNIGIAGGGVNALRGESNVQGSTDHGLLFDFLPGYLKSPTPELDTLDRYIQAQSTSTINKSSVNGWQNRSKYLVSLLKAWWGDHATSENGFAYDYLPKHQSDHSYVAMCEAMACGDLGGLVVWGQNPAVSSPDVGRERKSLERLDWLVVADLFENETAAFWKRPGAKPDAIQTEVFLLPAATSMEKEGSLTNSGRWVQWRQAAVEPAGKARSDLWMLDQLYQALKREYATSGVFPDPIQQLDWHYGLDPDPHAVAREINGRSHDGQPVDSFTDLKDDGTTSAGNWLYSGSYTTSGNQMARHKSSEPERDPMRLYSEWAWSWPANRRILYNRAGCDRLGQPWNAKKAVVRYDAEKARWIGDVPDGNDPPLEHPNGKLAFIMLQEGRARLFAPSLASGPLPEHYEPLESPASNLLSSQQVCPMLKNWRPGSLGAADRFPIVATTCRVSEHWQSGAMTRNLPWLIELIPNAFAEISRELAASKKIKSGDPIRIRSARGDITLLALVTVRMKPLEIDGRKVEQVAIVWHFGYQGLATGDSANLLTPRVGDADALIPEYKAFLCNIEKA